MIEPIYQVIGHSPFGDYLLQECETMEDAKAVKEQLGSKWSGKWSGTSIKVAEIEIAWMIYTMDENGKKQYRGHHKTYGEAKLQMLTLRRMSSKNYMIEKVRTN